MASDGKDRVVPRLIRFRDAPFYLGMDRNRLTPRCARSSLKSRSANKVSPLTDLIWTPE